jgi:hypothetical protein
MNTKTYLLAVVMSISTIVNAQVGDVGDLFGSGTENAELLFKSYFSPWINALGADLNGGWYNTASSHKPGGFDLTITMNTSFVPEVDKTFDLNSLGLTNVTFPNGSNSATAAGVKDGGKQIVYSPVPGVPAANVSIDAPDGTGVGFMLMPMMQVGVGLFKETDVSFRYMPKMTIGNVEDFGLWGVGLKHSIKQWIPGIAKVPVFQLALQGGYTKMSTNIGLDINPLDIGLTGTGDYSNQELEIEVTSFTMNLLVGASLPVVDFYGGIGFANTEANIALKGMFPVPFDDSGDAKDETNPIDIEVTNSDGNKVKPRVNVGMRLKLGIITFHADYTRANYNLVSGGIGISFR